MTYRFTIAFVLVCSGFFGLYVSGQPGPVSIEPVVQATDVLPEPIPPVENTMRFSFDTSNREHLALIVVVSFLVVFLAILFYFVPNIIRIKKQLKAQKGLRSQIGNIEESVCSMGGLGDRLIEIERRTMELGKMLSGIESELRDRTSHRKQLHGIRGS